MTCKLKPVVNGFAVRTALGFALALGWSVQAHAQLDSVRQGMSRLQVLAALGTPASVESFGYISTNRKTGRTTEHVGVRWYYTRSLVCVGDPAYNACSVSFDDSDYLGWQKQIAPRFLDLSSLWWN